MLKPDFESSIGYWIITVARDYERAFNAALVPRGITWRQAQVLGWLAIENDLTQTELAEKMGIEAPTLVGILDRMERDGWISRNDCPTDRRKKIVRARDQAEPVWEEVMACAQQMRSRALSGFTDAQRDLLIDMLRQVQDNLRVEACEKKTVGR